MDGSYPHYRLADRDILDSFYGVRNRGCHSHGGKRTGPLEMGRISFLLRSCFRSSRAGTEESGAFGPPPQWDGSRTCGHGSRSVCASHGDYTSAFATFKQHNGFSAYLSLCLPSALAMAFSSRGRSRLLYGVFALLQMAAFVKAYSRGAWMGLAAASGIIFGLKALQLGPAFLKRYGGVCVATFMFAAAATPLVVISRHPEMGILKDWSLLSSEDPSKSHASTRGAWDTSARPLYWGAAYRIFRVHPWVGIGPGNYARALPSYLDENSLKLLNYEWDAKHRMDFWSHLHSMYLQMLVEFGLVGFLLWSLAMTTLIMPGFAALSKAGATFFSAAFLISVTAFLIHNTVDILFVSSFDLLFITLAVMSRPLPFPDRQP